MKNYKSIILALSIVVIFSGAYAFFQKPNPRSNSAMEKDPQVESQEMLEEKNVAMEKIDNSKMMGDESENSRYIPYSKAVYDASADKRRVLFFYAAWCPTCKMAEEDFTANFNKIPENVLVIRTNYNDPDTDQEEKDLAKKYGITYQHTFVQIDAQGNEIVRWNGGNSTELLERIK